MLLRVILFMSKREPTLYFIDIFIAFNKINRYTQRFVNSQDFLHSELEWDATIRELEIIGEATNNLLNLGLINSKHRRIVDFRNQIIHGYFGIDEENDLKSLNMNLDEAIGLAQDEHSHNEKILNLLNTLKEEK